MELTCKLDQNDRIKIAEDVARRVMAELSTILEPIRGCLGIRVVSTEEAAKKLGRSVNYLPRMKRGPRRRKISQRRVGYFEHELEGIPASAVLVRDGRKIDPNQLSEKLGGLHRRTLHRMVQRGELPAPGVDGLWLERDIDDWLLERPLA